MCSSEDSKSFIKDRSWWNLVNSQTSIKAQTLSPLVCHQYLEFQRFLWRIKGISKSGQWKRFSIIFHLSGLNFYFITFPEENLTAPLPNNDICHCVWNLSPKRAIPPHSESQTVLSINLAPIVEKIYERNMSLKKVAVKNFRLTNVFLLSPLSSRGIYWLAWLRVVRLHLSIATTLIIWQQQM